MNEIIEKYRQSLVNELSTERIYMTKQEYDALESKVGVQWDYRKYAYYRNAPVEISDAEFNDFLKYKAIAGLEEIKAKQNKLDELSDHVRSIKNIMIFWLILTIISLISSIYVAVKIGLFLGTNY